MVYVIPILILVAFSALFSSTETAFACVNKIRLKHMADSGDKRAEKALDIANRYEQALTDALPHLSFDLPVDKIVTEAGVIEI